MTAPVLQAPLAGTGAVAYAREVLSTARRAAWPAAHVPGLCRAVSGLTTELEMYGRLADDPWARDAAPRLVAAFAERALRRAAALTELLEMYCTAEAVREGER